MNKIKIGILGVGHLGRFHTQNYKQIPDADIVGVYDSNMNRCQQIGDEFQVTAFESLESLLDKTDAVSIVVPTMNHFEITKALWMWARRRHPNKPKGWIKKRYFRRIEQGRDWCFHGRKNRKKATLTKASDVPIRRHIKITGQANPYDPEWEMYFERHLDRKTSEQIKGRGKVYQL